ncbi:MAG TPA: hypothetical protein VGC18_15245 [Lacisediminihabitans sp.]|uniref:hypothetical protein n=1 Tax=Lacisediminihabitans sp. TaxID=2787631 RepID=UPI002EDA0A9F
MGEAAQLDSVQPATEESRIPRLVKLLLLAVFLGLAWFVLGAVSSASAAEPAPDRTPTLAAPSPPAVPLPGGAVAAPSAAPVVHTLSRIDDTATALTATVTGTVSTVAARLDPVVTGVPLVGTSLGPAPVSSVVTPVDAVLTGTVGTIGDAVGGVAGALPPTSSLPGPLPDLPTVASRGASVIGSSTAALPPAVMHAGEVVPASSAAIPALGSASSSESPATPRPPLQPGQDSLVSGSLSSTEGTSPQAAAALFSRVFPVPLVLTSGLSLEGSTLPTSLTLDPGSSPD